MSPAAPRVVIGIGLAAVLVVAACGRDEPPRSGPDPNAPPPLDPIAERACACADFPCVVAARKQLVDRIGTQHLDPKVAETQERTLVAIDRCAEPLRARARDALVAAADALCACTDRACYDALGGVRNVPFQLPRGADLPQAWAQELLPHMQRFAECDARLSAP